MQYTGNIGGRKLSVAEQHPAQQLDRHPHVFFAIVKDRRLPVLAPVAFADVFRNRLFVDLLPTFVGCPALPVIEEEVRKRISALPGVGEVAVRFLFAPPWTVDRISPAGREALRKFGITVPAASEQPVCPLCGSATVHLESPFGPTRCRMIYYCESCRNSFEHLKRLSLA